MLDMSHGQGNNMIAVTIPQDERIILSDQVMDIGIQLCVVAPVIIPWFRL